MPRTELDKQLEKIKNTTQEMGELARTAVEKAIKALDKNDKKLAREVIIEDELIDDYETQLKRRCIQTMALHQPVASDLRAISVTMDVAYNLERIGDFATDIAESIDYMNGDNIKFDEISRMGLLAVEMVKKSINAFTENKKDLINDVMEMEDNMDELHKSIFPLLKKSICECKELVCKSEKECIPQLNIVLISKFLERIGDHSVNIAQRAMYKMSGKEKYL